MVQFVRKNCPFLVDDAKVHFLPWYSKRVQDFGKEAPLRQVEREWTAPVLAVLGERCSQKDLDSDCRHSASSG
jgi:hypothetical protein